MAAKYSILSFNSKLVRLEVDPMEDAMTALDMFQFQTGSIRSCANDIFAIVRYEIDAFQFQTGSIRSAIRMVECLGLRPFQFQTGSIKSGEALYLADRSFLVSIPNWFD